MEKNKNAATSFAVKLIRKNNTEPVEKLYE